MKSFSRCFSSLSVFDWTAPWHGICCLVGHVIETASAIFCFFFLLWSMIKFYTHMSIKCAQTWNIRTIAGHVIGLEICVSRWHSYTPAILHCRRPTCIRTVLDVETPPLVHIAMVLMRRQNIWCYTVQRTTRHGGSRGSTSTIKAIQDACGASWRGSGGDPSPDWEWERESSLFDCWIYFEKIWKQLF